jgi:hypothetical protein
LYKARFAFPYITPDGQISWQHEWAVDEENVQGFSTMTHSTRMPKAVKLEGAYKGYREKAGDTMRAHAGQDNTLFSPIEKVFTFATGVFGEAVFSDR